VERFLGKCRFRNCSHGTEPGCAIRAAIESGELPIERWQSYNKLKSEADYADDKISYLRQKQQWHKDIAKYNKQQKRSARNYGG
jgi:ribosome biogenesis GTPase